MSTPTVPRLGMTLPIMTAPETPGTAPWTLPESARRIEASGFASVWAPDSVGRGFFIPDPLVSVGVAAAATTHVELGTAIVQAPIHHTLELARGALTAWLACGERLLLGLGAGSTRADFDVMGRDYGGRFTQFETGLAQLRALWRGEQVDEMHLDPPADLLGGPPILVGAWSGTWVERAAREFGGWIASATRSWSAVERACARYRDAGGQRAVLATTYTELSARGGPPDADGPIDLRCPPEEARRRLERVASFGITDVVLISGDHTDENLAAIAALVAD
jgi:alkanesulfonate monooxygenase SsuD/methylene tetrahydromethanopterin reductase-like flavin-dependent oxidoreductase (luciferase family)